MTELHLNLFFSLIVFTLYFERDRIACYSWEMAEIAIICWWLYLVLSMMNYA